MKRRISGSIGLLILMLASAVGCFERDRTVYRDHPDHYGPPPGPPPREVIIEHR